MDDFETPPLTQLQHVLGGELFAVGDDEGPGGLRLEARPAVRYGQLIETVGRVFVPGVFADSIAAREREGRSLPMGWEHHVFARFQQIGKWGQAVEQRNGLVLKKGVISDTQAGRDAATLVRDGALDAASIGFMPLEFQFTEPKERVTFDTPFGKLSYQQDSWALYVITGDLYETSLVHAGADSAARARATQSVVQKAGRALPGLRDGADADDVRYSMALLMGGRGAAAFADLPDVEHFALYTRLAEAYQRLGLTTPAYDRRPEYDQVVFHHDERRIFSDRYLRKNLAAVVAGAGGIEGQLSPDTRAEAGRALEALARLLNDPDVARLAEIDGALRQAVATLRGE